MSADLIAIIEALPRDHRKWLIEKYRDQFRDKRKIKNEADGIQRLVDFLRPAGVAPYRNLYMKRSAHFFAWYQLEAKTTLDDIARNTKKHAKWRSGVRPAVSDETPPLFHRMQEDPDGTLAFDFVSDGGEHVVSDGYDYERRKRIVHDIIRARPTPLTVEISSRSTAHRDSLVESFAAFTGIDKKRFHIRALETPARRDAVATHFSATVEGEEGNGRAKNLASYAFRSKRGTPLDKQEDWKKVKAPHFEARVLEYVFTLNHPDGYPEVVSYFVNTGTGYIKFPPDISEYAINKVRDEVLRIAR